MSEGIILDNYNDAASEILWPDDPGEMVHHCAIFGISVPPGLDVDVQEKVLQGLFAQGNRGNFGFGLSGLDPFHEDEIRFGKTTSENPFGIQFLPHLLNRDEIAAKFQADFDGIIASTRGFKVANGHTRYPTSGPRNGGAAQPYSNDLFGEFATERRFSISFNGNIANAGKLKEFLEGKGYRFREGGNTIDTEILSTFITYIDQKLHGGSKSSTPADYEAIFKEVDAAIDGACNLILINGRGDMVGYRNRNGFRPLQFVVREDKTVVMASESFALEPYKTANRPIRELDEGHIAINRYNSGTCEIKKISNLNRQWDSGIQAQRRRKTFCSLEFVYFANFKSFLEGRSIELIRKSLAEAMAEEMEEYFAKMDPQLKEKVTVAPIPDTGYGYYQHFAEALGLHSTVAFRPNPFIPRTFLSPAEGREERLNQKFPLENFYRREIQGRHMYFVDDSLVRGATTRHVVRKVRLFKPSGVHLVIPSPMILALCFYGIDLAKLRELAAWNAAIGMPKVIQQALLGGNIEEHEHALKARMAQMCEADSLTMLSLKRFKKVLGKNMCFACMDRNYPTREGQEIYRENLDEIRRDVLRL